MLSYGLLMYRKVGESIEFFLVHPGGPYFKNKDIGYWTIPKGGGEPGEDGLATAVREFTEETGIAPQGPFHYLGEVRQKGKKQVRAWAFRSDTELVPQIRSNTFKIEWPPRSGMMQAFPEIDRGDFFAYPEAVRKINEAQIILLDRCLAYLAN